MGLQINNNIAAFNSYRNLSVTQGQMEKSLEKLSSGLRINRAADDAAGLSISEGLRAQVGGLKQAVRNAQDGISVVQTAEGALTEVHSILQRVRDLSVQAANGGSNNSESLTAIQSEITQLGEAVNDIATRTKFNGKELLDGTNTSLTFQTGANQGDTVDIQLTDITAVATAIAGLDVTTAGTAQVGTAASADYAAATAGTDADGDGDYTDAGDVAPTAQVGTAASSDYQAAVASGGAAAITAIDSEISAVSAARSTLGASQNRFESTIRSLNVAVENLSASESRIRDTDMALEMVNFTKNQILSQAGTAMLAQANQAPQGVLQLLR